MFKTRKESADFIRKQVAKRSGCGLELSPDINPIVRQVKGLKVEYLDVCSTQKLRDRAVARGRDPYSVPHIDHNLDFHKPILECVRGAQYDFAVSSHVIEHIPNLIGHFSQIDEVLKSRGLYAFLAPDKDLCFDCKKPGSSLGQLIEAFIENRTVSPISSMIDEYYYGVKRGDKAGWAISNQEPLRPKYGFPNNLIKGVISDPSKVLQWHGHVWKFTPQSFKEIYRELFDLGLVGLQLEDVVPTEHMEFIVLLRKE